MLAPFLTVKDVAAILQCDKDVARDRMQQVDFYFHLVDEPLKRVLRDGRTLKIKESSIVEFLEASENRFFPYRRWREDIMELAREHR